MTDRKSTRVRWLFEAAVACFLAAPLVFYFTSWMNVRQDLRDESTSLYAALNEAASEKALRSAAVDRLEDCNDQQHQNEARLTSCEQAHKEAEKEVSQLQEKLASAEERRREIEKILVAAQQERDKSREQLTIAQVEIRRSISELANERVKYTRDLSGVKSELEKERYQSQRDHDNYVAERDRLIREHDRYSDQIEGELGRTEKHTQELATDLRTERSRTEGLEQELRRTEADLKKLQGFLSSLSEQQGVRAPILPACQTLASSPASGWAFYGELHGDRMRNRAFDLHALDPEKRDQLPKKGDFAQAVEFVNVYPTEPKMEISFAGNIVEWFLPRSMGALVPRQWIVVDEIMTVPGDYKYVRYRLVEPPE